MHRHRHLLFHATAVLMLAACAEDTSTGVDPVDASLAANLALVVPTGVRDRLVVRNVSTVSDAVGPARTEDLGYGSYPSGDGPFAPFSSIWN